MNNESLRVRGRSKDDGTKIIIQSFVSVFASNCAICNVLDKRGGETFNSVNKDAIWE
jgi:hypothetical protein